ncbi:MAG: hypothetical protein KA712_09185 [Myxococcales bacterium]|nr:hypothetical protein [Myxococcales bacterium]
MTDESDALRSKVDDTKNQVSSAASEAKSQVQEKASALSDRVKEDASEAVSEKKRTFAHELGMLGQAIDRSAEHVDEHSVLKSPLHQAARFLGDASRSIESRGAGQILSSLEDFGRRQPTTMFGVALVAGFLATRVLRSGREEQDADLRGEPEHDTDDQDAALEPPETSFGGRPSLGNEAPLPRAFTDERRP